jgi:hypothetical protein
MRGFLELERIWSGEGGGLALRPITVIPGHRAAMNPDAQLRI